MKKFAYIFLAALILCMSCDPDLETHHPMLEARESPSQRTLYTPGNSDNPYDHVGRTYRESMTRAFPDIALTGILGQEGDTTNLWQLSQTLIIDFGLSTQAQTSLGALVDTMINNRYNEYSGFHDKMIAYEAKIIGKTALTDMDKQVILSFTSMIRHVNYPEPNVQGTSGVEDEDWDLSIPNAKEVVRTVLEHIEVPDSGYPVLVSSYGPSIQEP